MPRQQNLGGREPPQNGFLSARAGGAVFHASTRPPGGPLPSGLSLGRLKKAHSSAARASENRPMKWRHLVLLFVGLCWADWCFLYRPFPLLWEDDLLDLVAFRTPRFYG